MAREEYLEIPWSYEDTVENMKEIKENLQKQVLEINLHNRGEQDAKEVAFDFDRAIKALEKQTPKKAIYEKTPFGDFASCPVCKADICNQDFCGDCGQALDWREEND